MSSKVELSREQLRELQLNELELIAEVNRICEKNHIYYSLDGGTLLGAVRHKGFIPWDDDADVIFTRHEYARFYKACKRDLNKSLFFLQDYRTDAEYRWGYAKLRRKGTEYIRVNQEMLGQKTGVCIDIFVVDNVPDAFLMRKIYYTINFCIRKILYSELGKTAEKSAVLRKWYEMLSHIPKWCMFRMRNCIAARVNRKDTELVSHLLYPYPRKECKYGMPAECFKEYCWLEFEGMRFMAFKDYDRYLRILYGNYMMLPPIEKRVGGADACKIETIPMPLEKIQQMYHNVWSEE